MIASALQAASSLVFPGPRRTAPYSAEINSANNERHTEAKMSDDEREEDPRHASPRLSQGRGEKVVAASHRAIR